MMDGTAASILQQTKKFEKDPEEAKINELREQVKNHYLMIMKKPKQALKQV